MLGCLSNLIGLRVILGLHLQHVLKARPQGLLGLRILVIGDGLIERVDRRDERVRGGHLLDPLNVDDAVRRSLRDELDRAAKGEERRHPVLGERQPVRRRRSRPIEGHVGAVRRDGDIAATSSGSGRQGLDIGCPGRRRLGNGARAVDRDETQFCVAPNLGCC